MANTFSWAAHPEVGEYVYAHYSRMTSLDLARALQEQFGVTLPPGAVRDYYRHRKTREALEAKPPEPEPAPVKLPPPNARRPDQRQPMTPEQVAELYDQAVDAGERREATRLGQTTLTVSFAEERLPIGFCFWGDWQLGTSGVMMRRLKEDAETIRNVNGLYAFVMGDLVQNLNQRKHPESLHECILPDPRDQAECAKFILGLARGKIQGLVDGNHEHNSKQAAGLCPTEEWCKAFGFPYLWHGALVAVLVGEQSYTLGLRHQYYGESGINTTNAQRRMYEDWNPADVEVLAHRHYPDMQKRPKPGRATVFLRSGTYQVWDDFAQFKGGYKGGWGIPVVVLYPDERRVVPFYGEDFHKGLEFLTDQRRRYRDRLKISLPA